MVLNFFHPYDAETIETFSKNVPHAEHRRQNRTNSLLHKINI